MFFPNGLSYKMLSYSVPKKCLFLQNPSLRHTLSLQNASVVFQSQGLDHVLLLQNAHLILINTFEAHDVFLQNATAIYNKLT